MKLRLLVIRHAKSSWKSDAPTDHARPLNKRGKRDAPRVGAHLAEIGWVPELVLSSDAMRTKETWRLMRGELPDAPVSFLPQLYHASVADVVDALSDASGVKTVAVIGHNPTWEYLVEWLCGEETRMTTCNAALLTREGADWASALKQGSWTLEKVVLPREL